MDERIKVLEKRLQYFLENKLPGFWIKDFNRKIINGFLKSIEKNTVIKNGKGYIPNFFKININPNRGVAFQEIKRLETALKEILEEKAKLENLSFLGPVILQVSLDEKVDREFQIDANFSAPLSRKTVSLFSNDLIDESNDEQIHGFLIMPNEDVHHLKKKVMNIGRDKNNELVIDNFLVSRLHAQIREINGKHKIFDLDSTSGTKINGRRISQHTLSSGDVVEIADISIIYCTDINNLPNQKNGRITKPV